MTLSISSPGVCPSNTMVRGKGFPNLAGNDQGCLSEIPLELSEAGIQVCDFTPDERHGEVPYRHFGHLCGWIFTRAWYYWMVRRLSTDTSVVLPFEYADPLHATHGKEARASGDCACRSPRFWYPPERGHLGVEMYHVDTRDGLKALADAIRKWSQERAPDAAIRKEDLDLLGRMGLIR